MPLFEWNEKYSVGVSRFDQQHQELFALMNNLHDAVRKGQSRTALEGAFQQLFEYTERHLVDEEMAMKTHRYPAMANHRSQHEALRAKQAEFYDRYRNGEVNIGLEVVNFLIKWWTEHILRTDREYRDFFDGRYLAPPSMPSSGN